MPTYNTPGVWVEEIPTLPPSVAQVATAIPAFIGYTEKTPSGIGACVARISSLLDYESLFGKANPSTFKATVNGDAISDLERSDENNKNFLMYYGLSLYFRNSGGDCYIVSVGDYNSKKNKDNFIKGLELLEKEDEPTLIVLLDAVDFEGDDYYDLAQKALAQCKKLGDRFLILDVPPKDGKNRGTDWKDIKSFRDGIRTEYLAYGAAYHPYLNTTLNYQYDESGVQVVENALQWISGEKGLKVTRLPFKIEVKKNPDSNNKAVSFKISDMTLSISLPPQETTAAEVVKAWKEWVEKEKGGFSIVKNDDGSAKMTETRSIELLRALQWSSGEKGLTVTHLDASPVNVEVKKNPDSTNKAVNFKISDTTLSISLPPQETTATQVVKAWTGWSEKERGSFNIVQNDDGSDKMTEISATELTGILQWSSGEKGLIVTHSDARPAKVEVKKSPDSTNQAVSFNISSDKTLSISLPPQETTAAQVVKAWTERAEQDKGGFNIVQNDDGSAKMTETPVTKLVPGQPLALIKKPTQRFTIRLRPSWESNG